MTFKNLAVGIEEIKRYIQQQKDIIIYYEKAVADDESTKIPGGRTGMARFDSLMKATFNPPRNWTLLEDLKFYSDKLDIVSATMLRDCDVQSS